MALKYHQGNFDSTMSLSEESRVEPKCWIDSIESSYNVVHHGQPELTLKTDALTEGVVSYLELLGIFLALNVFVKKIMGKHVKGID